ncbi:MAG: RagB/SusD family nutrient uptake outer membrane protein [Gemmatimonadetes bacterium]|nr:RagB/SusD family nutrient uptake outer membrane protein [Gemmatimonadota bacterium]
MTLPSCFHGVWRAAAGLTLFGALAGCDRLLEVQLPARVPASELNHPSRAAALVQGTIADFECAYANYVAATAILSDELVAAGTTGPRIWDRRVDLVTNAPYATGGCEAYASFAAAFTYGVYTPLSTARFQADSNLWRISAFADSEVPGKDSLLATLAAYGGYAYTLFGEAFCWAAFDAGPGRSPPEVLAIAEQRFTTALEYAQRAGHTDMLNLARVGRARVRLDLGKLPEAAGDAKSVLPAGWVRYASRGAGSGRRENVLYVHNYETLHIAVDPRFRDVMLSGVPDPRVKVVNANLRGNDGRTPVWYQTKYPSESSPIPIASWDEAQLIIAEAEEGQSAVDRINALRARGGLPAFNSNDPAVIMQQVREERRRELFLEGHRLNDMLRFDLAFDVGETYGRTARLPLPQVEIDHNPNIRALDPNPAWRCQR